MPHFEEFYANKLRGGLGVVTRNSVLDLRERIPRAGRRLDPGHAGAQPLRASEIRRHTPGSARKAAARPCSNRSARPFWRPRSAAGSTGSDLSAGGRPRILCGFGRKAGARGLTDRSKNRTHPNSGGKSKNGNTRPTLPRTNIGCHGRALSRPSLSLVPHIALSRHPRGPCPGDPDCLRRRALLSRDGRHKAGHDSEREKM